MSISSSAPVSVLSDQLQTKTTLAATFTKQNAQNERSVANIVEASAQNLKQIGSSKGPGVGSVVDRRA